MSKSDYQLLDDYLDGRLAVGDFDRLETLLDESEEARARLRVLATVEEGLSDFAQEEEESTKVVAFPPRSRNWLPWAIATAACLVLLFQHLGGFVVEEESRNPNQNIVALVVDEAGAVFAEGKSPGDGIRFEVGDFRLEEGAVHLRFSNGTDLVMSAPAEFAIRDPLRVDLAEGKVRAIVPPSGHGFTIGSPGVDYEDIGTEFGVSVRPGGGGSELHVFDGQVNVRKPKSSDLLRAARVGDSLKFADGEISTAEPAQEGEFLTPGAIGYLRWKKWQEEFAKSPGLIGFFGMDEPVSSESETILNSAANPIVSDGRILGARWVTGRWPEKKALLFDRDLDAVELEIPGEFDELSMSVWINVDRLDRELSAILDSNEWELGDVHWQISRTGIPWVGVNEIPHDRTLMEEGLVPGKWSHVAFVISKPDKRITVYVNGRPSMVALLKADGPIAPGVSRLGNWLRDPEWPHAPVRGLQGRIDELAIWNRALSEEEIFELVKLGQPTALWSADGFTTSANFRR